jgi:hypothetical protein
MTTLKVSVKLKVRKFVEIVCEEKFGAFIPEICFLWNFNMYEYILILKSLLNIKYQNYLLINSLL